MNKNKIIHEGEIDLAGLIISCYVLEDGTRILSGRGMQTALSMTDDEEDKKTAGSRLNRHLTQKTLQPYLYNDKEVDHYEPIDYFNGSEFGSLRNLNFIALHSATKPYISR